MENANKIAYIHCMRSGGTYAVSQLINEGWKAIDSWRDPFKWGRDWTKEESLEIAREKHVGNVLFHNHIVSWDQEILNEFKKNNWTTFTIVRDPLEQLCSLYHLQLIGSIYRYSYKDKTPDVYLPNIDEFLNTQCQGGESLLIDANHWALPEWWKEIDVILPYQKEMAPVLRRAFGINKTIERTHSVKRKTYKEYRESGEISDVTHKCLISSEYYKRYNETQNNKKQVVVLITTCGKNVEERKSLRETWIKDLDCPYFFVIGREGQETSIEGDILYVNCGDSYEHCPIKQLMSLKHINEKFIFDYVFCCDDDTYVYVDRLFDSGFELYDYYGGGPIFEHGDPHYVQGGAGIFLSKLAVETISNYPNDGDHVKSRWSDMMTGKIMHDAKIEAVYNDRFVMGHEEVILDISRDFSRTITQHKLSSDRIREADIDINPFHIFDKIYWINNNFIKKQELEESLQDVDILHLVTIINGDIKEAVSDAKKNELEKILIITDDDIFVFRSRDVSRLFFNEIRNWEIIALGVETKRSYKNTPNSLITNEAISVSCLGLTSKWYDSFIESESLENWIHGKEICFPNRMAAFKNKFNTRCDVIPNKEISKPIKVALITKCFKRGGAEIEFNEMLTRLNPEKVQWVGIACETCFQFDISPNYKQNFPPVYVNNDNIDFAVNLDGVNICSTFEEAVLRATENADVVIKWHLNHPIIEVLPQPSIALANTFGRWVLGEYSTLKADMYVGNSDHSGKVFPVANARTIYSGHSEDRLKTNKGRKGKREQWKVADEKIIGYIGRLDMSKNLSTVIKAVGLLPDNYKLALIGQPVPNIFDEVEKLLETHLKNRYIIDEWNDCVGDAISAIDCFVLVSDYEGFSNALAEAWMMNIPTVFSRCGSVMELENRYGKMGISVNTGVKPLELSNRIKESLRSENKENIDRAKLVMKNFSIEKSAKDWEDAIQDVYKKSLQDYKLKVGIICQEIDDETRNLIDVLKTCSQDNSIQYFTLDIKDELFVNLQLVDVLLVLSVEQIENFIPEDYEKPIFLVSKHDEGDRSYKSKLEKSLNFATHLVSTSLSTREEFPKIVQKTVNILPNGFIPSRTFSNKEKTEQKKSWGLDDQNVVVGFIGDWSSNKNYKALLKSTNYLPASFKDIYFVSEEEIPEQLTGRLVKRLKEDVSDYFKGIDVLLVPSMQESFGKIIVQAWVNGIPVVSTSVGVFKDMWAMYGFPFGVPIKHNDDGFTISNAIIDAYKMSIETLSEIRGHALYRFNGITVADRWQKHLRKNSEMYWDNAVILKLKQKVQIMVSKSTPKRAARELNRSGIPAPDGSAEWTYKSVLDFIASS